jgi:hypothetical protein
MPEPELANGVEDTERPSNFDSAPEFAPPVEERPAPQADTNAAPVTAHEAPRRRSTIREPAAFNSDSASSAPPNNPSSTPVISSTGADEAATPKRGWWAKRLLGDKG